MKNNRLNILHGFLSVIILSVFVYYFITNNAPRLEFIGLSAIMLLAIIIEIKRHKKCIKCKAKYNLSQNYCGHCGAKLNDDHVIT